MKEDLGDRMKKYEDVNRNYLIPRTYTIIRIDGKSFHTFTRGLEKPWDESLILSMIKAMEELCKKIQGCKFGYMQSDEISLVLTDFDTYESQAWFGGNIQKIVSVSASIATKSFNNGWVLKAFKEGNLNVGNYSSLKWGEFDSRVFQLPNREEAVNYFIWRQKDAIRNSIFSLAQSLYSPKQLYKKSQEEMKEMCFRKGKSWDDHKISYQRGWGYKKETDILESDLIKETWKLDEEIPIFSEDRDYLYKLIPNYI